MPIVVVLWLVLAGLCWGQPPRAPVGEVPPAGVTLERALGLAAKAGPVRELRRADPGAGLVGRWVPGEGWLVEATSGLLHREGHPEPLVDVLLSPGADAIWRADMDPRLALHLRPRLPPWAELALAAAALWLAFGRRRLWAREHLDIALLLAIVPLLLLPQLEAWLPHTGIYLLTLLYFLRALWAAGERPSEPGESAGVGSAGVLAGCLLLAIGYHGWVIATGVTEDSGVWGCFGAQHLLREGQWPYGQPHFGDGSTYGPLLYLLLAPLVALFPPGYVADGGAFVPLVEEIPPTFERLEFAASKWFVAGADLAIIAALVVIGRRWRDWRLGLGLALAYAVLPQTLIELIHPSRALPAAFVLAGVALAARPAWSGAMLGCAIASMHFPVVLVPLWWGRYEGRDRWRFLAPLALIGLACLAAIEVGESSWGRFWVSTWENLEGEQGYGSSPFGVWGVNPDWTTIKRPLRYLMFAWCLWLARWPAGRRDPRRLAALTAAVLVAIQLWKTHAGGQYITWYLPLLLLAMFAVPARRARADRG